MLMKIRTRTPPLTLGLSLLSFLSPALGLFFHLLLDQLSDEGWFDVAAHT
jgi:hypothetical protein